MKNKLWYAVQMDRDDDWGIGSYDFDEAMKRAKGSGAELIAVIEEGDNPVCIDEIYLYDSFRVSAVFEDGTTADNDVLVPALGRDSIEAELEEARKWFSEQNPACYMISYYKDGEFVRTELREA